ncbi:MAG TPA: hypothetical protein VJ992_12605 [Gemmatimonadales bacterium]|nr:hypothetical protein [Gemmatimonadales bacterium]
MKVELIYFQGCPHVAEARANLAVALERAQLKAPVREWDRDDPAAPPYTRQYPSPTVLVNGRDVSGGAAGAGGASCRAAGAPSVERIHEALAET